MSTKFNVCSWNAQQKNCVKPRYNGMKFNNSWLHFIIYLLIHVARSKSPTGSANTNKFLVSSCSYDILSSFHNKGAKLLINIVMVEENSRKFFPIRLGNIDVLDNI